jgi:hypothetical protein
MKVYRPKLVDGTYQVVAKFTHYKLIGFDSTGRYITEPEERVEIFYGCDKTEALNNAYKRLDVEIYEQQRQIKTKNFGKGLVKINEQR